MLIEQNIHTLASFKVKTQIGAFLVFSDLYLCLPVNFQHCYFYMNCESNEPESCKS